MMISNNRVAASLAAKRALKVSPKGGLSLALGAAILQALGSQQVQAQTPKFILVEGASLVTQNLDGSIQVLLLDGTIADLDPGEFRIVGDDIYVSSSAIGAVGGFSWPSLTTVVSIIGGVAVFVSLLPKEDPPDESAPVFQTPGTADLNEGETWVQNIQASDEAEVTYSLVGGADQTLFSIDAKTGELTFIAPPDFESLESSANSNTYAVLVRATDALGNFADQTIIINVLDVDETPQFETGSASASVDENMSGVVIYTAQAADVVPSDNSKVVYSLDAAAIAAGFSIDPETGEITLNQALDYEDANGHVYGLTITAQDEVTGASATQSLTLSVANVNEVPIFEIAAKIVSFDENSTDLIYIAQASDIDNPDALTYSLDAASLALGFMIDEATGEIRHGKGLNYEDGVRQYTLVITATDVGGLTATQSLILTLKDEDESAPIFTSSDTADSVEGQLQVYTATTDEIVTYALSGDDAHLFSLDENTGVLTFGSAPDFDNPGDKNTDNVYEITLTATDFSENSTDLNLSLTVREDTQVPNLGSASASVFFTENQSTDTLVFTAGATDNSGSVVYSLGGVDAAHFDIDSQTGELRFNETHGSPNFEDPKNKDDDSIYDLIIIATDPEGNEASQNLEVKLVSVNEAPTFKDASVDVTVDENTTSIFYQVQPIDVDAGDILSYQLDAQAVLKGFIIDNQGQIRHGSGLDFEAHPTPYDITVTVEDLAGLSASQTVKVSVNDLDEIPPIFTSGSSATAVEGKVEVYQATANEAVTFTLSGTDSDLFQIDGATGKLSFKTQQKFKSAGDNDYDLIVTARDLAGNETDLNFSLTVTKDTEAPNIGPTSQSINFEEKQAIETLIFTASATDNSGSVTYELSGTDAAHFNINENTGELTFSSSHGVADFENPLDNDRDRTYEITVTAMDLGENSASQNLFVTLVDVA